MRKVALSEVILSLVMPRDRAAATAGDFAESSRDTLTLVWSLASTLCAAAVSQVSPSLFAKSAGLAVLLMWSLRGVFVSSLITAERILPKLSWLGTLLGVEFLLFGPVLVGFLMGRWVQGRELATWLGVALFVAFTTVIWFSVGPARMPVVLGALLETISPAALLPLLLGFLLARRESLLAGLSSQTGAQRTPRQ